MNRWSGKVAVVTGASSGIGLATAKALVGHGLIVVGLARRIEKMENGMKSVKGPGKFYARQCDITKAESIVENLNWTKDKFGTINVLINNAGVMYLKPLEEATVAELTDTVNVNLLGLLNATKHAIPILKGNEKEAHIININSVLGHRIPEAASRTNVYPATKYAVTALSANLSMELKNSNIRVTSVSPGFVKTEMTEKALKVDSAAMESMPGLNADDIANAIVYALSAPVHVEINEIILQGKKSYI